MLAAHSCWRRACGGTEPALGALRQNLWPRRDALEADWVPAGQRRDCRDGLSPDRALAKDQVDPPMALRAVRSADERTWQRVVAHDEY